MNVLALLSHRASNLIAVGALIACGLSSCAGPQAASKGGENPKTLAIPTQPPIYSWDESLANSASGPVRIKIALDQQRARFYKGKTEVGWTAVASGIDRFPSPTGSFSILEKTVDKKSNLYGKIYSASGGCINSDAKAGRDKIPSGGRFEGARMAYWMRLTHDGVGMHIGPLPRPGYQASHGCIRLPDYMAKQFYQHAPLGTPVTITRNDGTEPLSKSRDAYEAELAAYTTWVNGKWDEHNARLAKSPEARREAREKLKAEEKSKKLAAEEAERLAEAEEKAARRARRNPAPVPTTVMPAGIVEEQPAPSVVTPVAAQPGGPGQTVYLDSSL